MRLNGSKKKQFIHPSATQNSIDHAIRYFCGDSIKRENVCSWHGIHCCSHTGEMTSLSMVSEAVSLQITVAMDWLPPTLKSIHLRNIFLDDGWVAERLPRDTEYLFMGNVVTFNEVGKNRRVDFRRLPVNMEELILQASWLRGGIVLTDLPKKMRILWLQHIMCTKAFIEPDLLPNALAYIYIQNYRGNAELRGLDMKLVEFPLYSLLDQDKMFLASKEYVAMEVIGSREL